MLHKFCADIFGHKVFGHNFGHNLGLRFGHMFGHNVGHIFDVFATLHPKTERPKADHLGFTTSGCKYTEC